MYASDRVTDSQSYHESQPESNAASDRGPDKITNRSWILEHFPAQSAPAIFVL